MFLHQRRVHIVNFPTLLMEVLQKQQRTHQLTHDAISYDCICDVTPIDQHKQLGEASKNTVLFTFGQRRGVSANPRNPYQKILTIFYQKLSFFYQL